MLPPVAIGLDLLVEQVHDFLEDVQVLGASDNFHLLAELPAALLKLKEMLQAEPGQRAAGALKRKKLIQFLGGQPARLVRVSVDPGNQFRLGGPLVELTQRIG